MIDVSIRAPDDVIKIPFGYLNVCFLLRVGVKFLSASHFLTCAYEDEIDDELLPPV